MPISKTFTIQLLAKKMLTADIMELRFTKPTDFTFIPGQFVQVHIPERDGTTVLRSYSIASSSTENYLEFCLKILPTGKGSNFFSKLNIMETVVVNDSKGVFIIGEHIHNNIFFIATGTGLAPIMSIISSGFTTSETKPTPSITSAKRHLLFGVRSEQDLFWVDRLDKAREQSKAFSHTVTLSQPSSKWLGLKGRVTEHLPTIITDTVFYLCGSLPMIKEVRAYLVAKGVTVKNIHLEIF